MVTLYEQVDLPVPFERLCEWTDHFETEFVRWSPYHLACEYLDGSIGRGKRLRFYEIVMGMDYDVTGTITEYERDKDHFSIAFESDAKTAVIRFEGERTPEGCRFGHTEAFGLQTPVIAPLLNFLVFKVFFRKKADWNVIRADMQLDNQYLYDILVKGKYPDRIPPEELKKGQAKPA